MAPSPGPTDGEDGTGTDEVLLDCTDLACPVPVIELGRHITEVPVGGVVRVRARDVAARTDVPAWCRMRGHEYAGEATSPAGVPEHRVRRAH